MWAAALKFGASLFSRKRAAQMAGKMAGNALSSVGRGVGNFFNGQTQQTQNQQDYAQQAQQQVFSDFSKTLTIGSRLLPLILNPAIAVPLLLIAALFLVTVITLKLLPTAPIPTGIEQL